jgi:hypothetical protein
MKSKYLIILLLSLQLSSEAFTLTPIGIKLVNKLHRGEIQRVTSIKMVEENKKKSTSISWSKNEGLQFFDIPATPEIWMIAIVYFIQGLLGISRLALSFYYKDTLHLSPVDLTLISSITAIPWIIKPFYGFISDTFPLFGYKRKSYLALSGILGSISWCLMALLAKSLQCGILQGNTATIATSIFLASLSSLSIAFSDVLVDAIVVGKSRDQSQAGSLQSLCWSSNLIHLLQNKIELTQQMV